MTMRWELINPADAAAYTSFIQNHPKSCLFHQLSWLNFICEEHNGKLKIYRIYRGADVIGYWPFISTSKGPFRLSGSPLRGWLTSNMGPVLNEEISGAIVDDFLKIIFQEKPHYIEISNPFIPQGIMEQRGFKSDRLQETWILSIQENEEAQWKLLEYNCQKNLKKALKEDIKTVELTGTEFFPQLYELISQVYLGKNMAVPFSIDRLYLLHKHLAPMGQFLFLGMFKNDEFIGGHIWGVDHQSAYALAVGTKGEYNALRISNLIIWEGIKKFIAKKIRFYDMYGGGKNNPGVAKFKASFGSTYSAIPHYALSRSKTFSCVLNCYEKYYPKVSSLFKRA